MGEVRIEGTALTPGDHLKQDQAPWPISHPPSVFLCYRGVPVAQVVKNYPHEAHYLLGHHFYWLPDERLGLLSSVPMGAPATAALAEQLRFFGVREMVGLGAAGSLLPPIGRGDVVIATKAFRDEGVSRHYLPPGDWVTAHAGLNERLERLLGGHWQGSSWHRGAVWTTDAVYRETPSQIARHSDAGTAVVDMEAAALFAVAQHHGFSSTSVFWVSDEWRRGGAKPWVWSYEENIDKRRHGMGQLLKVFIDNW